MKHCVTIETSTTLLCWGSFNSFCYNRKLSLKMNKIENPKKKVQLKTEKLTIIRIGGSSKEKKKLKINLKILERHKKRLTMMQRAWTKLVLLLATLVTVFFRIALSGNHGHGGGLEKLLAAGLVAKALAKGDGHHGGHHYMPVHVPVHHHHGHGGHHHHGHGRSAAASGHTHHHIHHKYVPIPVKHHTNFIIAHHKVPVPVHVPYPVVKTKVVHVPVEQTKIVPVIVTKNQGHAHQLATNGANDDGASYYSPADSKTQVRFAKVNSKPVKYLTSSSARSQKSSSSQPRRWIVVVKNRRRSDTTKRFDKKS